MSDDDFQRVATDDGQTFVLRDRGSGPLVVLIHGFPDTPHTWDGIAARLNDAGYRTVAPWLRGYHPDTIVAGRGYDALAIGNDPIRLLDALGEQSGVLVGHDWGASTVYGAANLAPERVRAIVPIAIPHPSLLKMSPKVAWDVRHFAALRLPWAERSTARQDFKYVDTLYRRWSPNWSGPVRDMCVTNVKACFAEPSSLHAALEWYCALSLKPPKVLARPPQVRGLVVGGTADISPPELFVRTAEALPQPSVSFIVEGAGHWPHREGEDQFVDALLAFLRTVEG